MSEIIVKGRRCVICNTAVGSVVIRCKDDPEYDLTYDGDWSKTSRVHFDTREAAEAFAKQHADKSAGERPEGLYAVVSGSEDPLPIVRLWRGNRWWDHRGIEVSIYQDWQPLETAPERALRKRVAELEKERDEWKSSAEYANETLGKVAAERDELRKQVEASKDASGPLPIRRSQLGRIVREAWVRWANMQPNVKSKWLVPYDQLDEADKEADNIIGESVARSVMLAIAARNGSPVNDELRQPQEVVRGGGTLRPGVWVYGKNGVFDDAFAAFESEKCTLSEYTYVRVGDIPAFPAKPEPQFPAEPKWGRAVFNATGIGVLWRPIGESRVYLYHASGEQTHSTRQWLDNNYTIISEPGDENAN